MAIKEFVIDGQTVAVEILEQHPAYFKFKINEKIFEVSLEAHEPGEYGCTKQTLNLVINNHPVKIKYSNQQAQSQSFDHKNSNEKLLIYIINQCTKVFVEPAIPKQIKHAITPKPGSTQNLESAQTQSSSDKLSLRSPLAGRVVKILVKTGNQVNKDQPLVIIESMKMENEIRATFPGFVKNISISEGNLVQQNQVLITFE